MRRILSILFLFFIWSVTCWSQELKEKLESLSGISQIETLNSADFSEKYLVRISQAIDPKDPSAGTFTQRVVVCHVGFDRPTVIVTEGYGGAYAQSSHYRDELSKLFNTNIIHVEHRYFLESTPEALNWDYLTAENSAYDLHHVTTTFKQVYPEKWISTGISKGGQTVMIYRSFFPDDVDISVPYVAPLCWGVEDGRHEVFLKKVGTKSERKQILNFQKEVLKRRNTMVPMLESFCKEKELTFRVPIEEVLDYCVLEYDFAFWQWGSNVNTIPSIKAEDKELFDHLMKISGPDYFADEQPLGSFFVQAARELGYYGYNTKPFKKLLSINGSDGYLTRIMLPESAKNTKFNQSLYYKIYNYLKYNDPKMLFIYGEIDPWSAPMAPRFKGRKNTQFYIQPRGSHSSRISNMPDETKDKIIVQITAWLEE
ncbi:aminopeptidase [Parabacteroides sp. OttesenSCG-928-G07]|nr:aminopeptidase [Parabacteroides sp. OttesenSCG-928-G21]MDL2277737.1 aminopeptidase [Parabacteroides sp. OttesenSCG-928-G07]